MAIDFFYMAQPPISFAPLSECDKKENNMHTDININTTNQPDNEMENKRSYLKNRLFEIQSNKEQDARWAFYLDAKYPQTAQEVVDRILAGKYTLDEKNKDTKRWSPWDKISWVTSKPDQKGFDEWFAADEKTRTIIHDTIAIGDPADALKAVQEYENSTLH